MRYAQQMPCDAGFVFAKEAGVSRGRGLATRWGPGARTSRRGRRSSRTVARAPARACSVR
jgi:hypothetical protein